MPGLLSAGSMHAKQPQVVAVGQQCRNGEFSQTVAEEYAYKSGGGIPVG